MKEKNVGFEAMKPEQDEIGSTYLVKGMRGTRTPIVIGIVAAAVMLSGCSIAIKQPNDGAVIKLPTPVHVVVTANASMSNLRVNDVTPNGTINVTNQISYVSGEESSGNLNLLTGNHTISAEADVYCWYCTQQTSHSSDKKNICVAVETWPPSYPSYTAVGRSNTLSWSKTSDTAVGVAADTGVPQSRWYLIRVGGLGQSIGRIQSTENSCLCMRSMDGKSGTPIGLAICDGSDQTQLWEAFEMPNTNGNSRFQNFGRSTSDACLTQDSNGLLIQRPCLDTDDQLWKIRDKTANFVRPFW